MEKPSLFIEIFGLDEITAPPLRDIPSIPVLDTDAALRDFRKSAGAADAEVREIELQELTDLLAPTPDVSADVARFSPEPKPASGPDAMFSKLVEEVLPSVEGMRQLTPETSAYVKRFLDTYTKTPAPSRRAEVAKGDSRRSLDIAEIVDDWAERYDLPTIGTTGDALSRIKRSMAALTNELVMEASL